MTSVPERVTDEPTTSAEPKRRGVLAAYLALTKPRVIELLLVTTIPAMFLAERGIPSPWLVLVTLAGGAMSAGSANALNCVADSDIDAVMHRTRSRPLVSYEVPRKHALIFGIVLGAASFGILALGANLLAAVLSLAAILFYVFVYTLVLKRRTSQNIVWGGAAGCMPVVIGWAAVAGKVEWPALVMFGVVFLWTPPHFWSLAMKYRDDYASAGVPMLPVVATPRQVSARILVYSYATVACTLLLVPATSWIYVAFAVLAGTAFLVVAQRLHGAVRRNGVANPMVLFHLSNSYLTVLSVAIAVDAAVGLPSLG
ncbi:MAG: heme o synthase [Saccharopolyspora sp.]|uniref:heme o synthase n=1 Tax=Saccharopolyspora TaxID=1835 RepID=UPI001909A951|nr:MULTISPECIES: heme o synthase [unclassified Saccharopolyspora]MBK0868151.1 protoheme IX farnesyltransferase [Saccharopolyspora sp. HNM0986]MBQ6642163.1 heme o synthase [Saccharopolyspora sp.]